ncbi:uroporphyrinogen decarboxylase [Rhodopila sp.]|uniref:uroporphyrinogen decarboxylase n=1 Tax=Rhodopila sp. TaxID=2480087 RepID=UPI002CE2CACE|nr:uroporphyrinogen decarboxylase [Rhodopila sp.]HVZ08571.1 uroporphyrinogen decarboxylase [Rhodopila sp.]
MKPLLRALNGEAVWPPPMWLMRQAGRYLPEYRAVRTQVRDFMGLCTNPDLAAEVTLQPIRRYGFDAAILFSDILVLPWALGHGLEFREGEGPVLPKLRDRAGLAALDPTLVAERVAPVMETVRLVRTGLRREGFEGGTALIGFAGAPFTVACYMIEGGGSRDFGVVRAMAYAQPALFQDLMDLLTETTVQYLSAQVEAGAEALMLFDSWAGILAPSLFRRHVVAPARIITAALKRRYPHVPVIGFPRLAGLMLGGYADTGVDGIGVDTGSDLRAAASMLPASVAVQGNLDPMALVAGGDALTAEARAVLAAARGRPFIFNLGHGIVPQTPPEHVAMLREQVRGA